MDLGFLLVSLLAMSSQVILHSIPDNSPLKVLLLRKCLRRVDKLKVFGIEKVRYRPYFAFFIFAFLFFPLYLLTSTCSCLKVHP